jgi:lipopolysaccharide transport system permease protein
VSGSRPHFTRWSQYSRSSISTAEPDYESLPALPRSIEGNGPTLDRPENERGTRRSDRVVEIAPIKGALRIDFGELWSYRELLLLLVWRDVKSRYSQTVIGAGWAVLQPVLTMVVFTVIFGRFARLPSDGVPYSVFSLAALVPWTYFSSSLSGSSNSLVNSRPLLTKVYFPRLLIPAASILAMLVDFAIAFLVLLLVMLSFGIVPRAEVIWTVPAVLIILSMTAMGAGSWLAALNVQYHDVRYLSPFLVQVWMYASPIVYSITLVPQAYRPILAVNPLSSALSGFRAAMLGTPGPRGAEIGLSFLAALAILVAGVWYFRRTERVFADVA